MDVDAASAAPAQAGAAPTAAAAADPEAQLASAVAAAAVSAAVQGLDGPLAAAAGQASQQLGAAPLDQQQGQLGAQLSAEELAQRAQQDEQRATLLATRLADVLLPPAQQHAPAGASDAAQAAGSGAAATVQPPSVVVDGRGLDWAIRWRHAGASCGQANKGQPCRRPCIAPGPARQMHDLRICAAPAQSALERPPPVSVCRDTPRRRPGGLGGALPLRRARRRRRTHDYVRHMVSCRRQGQGPGLMGEMQKGPGGHAWGILVWCAAAERPQRNAQGQAASGPVCGSLEPFWAPAHGAAPALTPWPPLPRRPRCSNIWQHTRCYHIPDDQPVPEHQFTCDTCRAQGVPAAQHATPSSGA